MWIYYGYDPIMNQAIAYIRFRDREVIEYQTENNHFIPKYFGLYLGNVEGSTSGWNGDMKDWHLCLGSGCAR